MAKKQRKTKVPAAARAYFIGRAQQKYQDEKSRLFDDYDYDRISRAEYERRLKEAFDELQATINVYK